MRITNTIREIIFFFCIKISRECKYLHVTSICLNESHFTATTSAPYLNNPYIRARQSQIAEIRTRSTSWNREIFPRGKFSTTVVMDPRPLPAGPQARKRWTYWRKFRSVIYTQWRFLNWGGLIVPTSRYFIFFIILYSYLLYMYVIFHIYFFLFF